MNNYNQYNNSGDNIMNFGLPPRELNDSLKQQLKQNIDTSSKVDVTAVLGDGEAFKFASEIKSFLISEGYEVGGVNQAVFSGPVKGQIIEPPKNTDDKFKIIIGTRE